MRRFADLYSALDASSGTGARVEALAAYFATADPARPQRGRPSNP